MVYGLRPAAPGQISQLDNIGLQVKLQQMRLSHVKQILYKFVKSTYKRL